MTDSLFTAVTASLSVHRHGLSVAHEGLESELLAPGPVILL